MLSKKIGMLFTFLDSALLPQLLNGLYGEGGDGMNRLDQTIADITYVRSCLKLLQSIQESGDCNICKKKRTCEYVPKLGEQVRYNCPFFESEVTE